MKIIGVKEINYVSKKTGKDVHGFEFIGSFASRRCVVGDDVEKQYISDTCLEESGGVVPCVGDEVEFVYNRFGNVVSFNVR